MIIRISHKFLFVLSFPLFYVNFDIQNYVYSESVCVSTVVLTIKANTTTDTLLKFVTSIPYNPSKKHMVETPSLDEVKKNSIKKLNSGKSPCMDAVYTEIS